MLKVLAGASCRRLPSVLEAHLQTLRAQRLPENVQLDLMHVDDTVEQAETVRELLRAADSHVVSGVEKMDVMDFNDANEQTHHWNQSAFERVARNKQKIFDHAVANGYDYVWIVDTDLLLDPMTLSSLLSADKPIIAAVYWTRWQPNTPAAPQVWLNHPYELQGRGYDAASFRRRLTARTLTRVYGLGACMLVKTPTLGKTRYWPLLPQFVAQGGMMAGEDRTFCALAEASHIEMWADPWPDIFHVYRPSDENAMDDFRAELKAREDDAICPTFGDLVNLSLVPLEDPLIGPQSVRGRVGALKLLPELEREVLRMRRGESRLLPVTFPLDYELAGTGAPPQQIAYRGQRKIIEVTLIDHKPFGFPPVLREDLLRPEEDYLPKDTYLYERDFANQITEARQL